MAIHEPIIDLVAATDHELVALLGDAPAEVMVAEGHRIATEGETSDSLWYVVDGAADVTVGGRYLGSVGPGEAIGETSVFDEFPRIATVTARTPMRLLVGDATHVRARLSTRPELALAVIELLTARLRDANARILATGGAMVAVDPSPASVAHEPDVSAGPVAFDPFAPGYFEDPTVQLGRIREAEPVHHIELTDGYLLSRYEHVHAIARDRRFAVGITHARSTTVIEQERAMLADAEPSMLRLDGDDHLRLRRLVTRAFTPKAISKWRERATAVADELLDGLAARGGGDLIADYALPLPVRIISDMLGMPMSELPRLRAWSHTLAKSLDPLTTPADQAAAVTARHEMEAFIDGIYDAKADDLRDDIFSALIEAEHDGDRLTRDEVISNILLLYVAGHETTTNLIGNGIIELLRNPDQLDLWRARPDLDGNGVEEVLRYNSPVQFTRRVSPVEDIEVDGVTIPGGSVVMLAAAAANRDPRKWGPTADVFRVDREGANDQVSFGGGPHFCLGAALARLEGQIALPRAIRRFPKLRAVTEPRFEARMVLRGSAGFEVAVN